MFTVSVLELEILYLVGIFIFLCSYPHKNLDFIISPSFYNFIIVIGWRASHRSDQLISLSLSQRPTPTFSKTTAQIKVTDRQTFWLELRRDPPDLLPSYRPKTGPGNFKPVSYLRNRLLYLDGVAIDPSRKSEGDCLRNIQQETPAILKCWWRYSFAGPVYRFFNLCETIMEF